jgi:hypothetical protein
MKQTKASEDDYSIRPFDLSRFQNPSHGGEDWSKNIQTTTATVRQRPCSMHSRRLQRKTSSLICGPRSRFKEGERRHIGGCAHSWFFKLTEDHEVLARVVGTGRCRCRACSGRHERRRPVDGGGGVITRLSGCNAIWACPAERR